MKKYIALSVYTIFVFGVGFFCQDFDLNKFFTWMQKTMHRPMISVVLPTYNRAHALPIAVDSILNQTYSDFELIIIDDGSTDGTDAVIEELARQDKRIVPLKNRRNKGLVYSLNKGIDAARGKYIARMDDDDESVSYRFEREILAMEAHPEITVLGAKIFSGKNEPPKPIGAPEIINPDEVEIDTYLTAGLNHPTIMIRRDFLIKNNIRYNNKYLHAEDTGLYKDILNAGGKLSYLYELLLNFAVVKDVVRPKNYLYVQEESFKRVQKEKIGRFFNVPYEWLGPYMDKEHQCLVLTRMAQINPRKKILNQILLEQRQREACQYQNMQATEVLMKHPRWQDIVNYDSEKQILVRESTQDIADVQILEGDLILVKWEKWGDEIFKKESPKTWIYVKDKDGIVKTKDF